MKEHGFSNQLANVKLLKHAKEIEEVEDLTPKILEAIFRLF
jgi:hypothetical protein